MESPNLVRKYSIQCSQLEQDNKTVWNAHDKLRERLEEKDKGIFILDDFFIGQKVLSSGEI